jgi:hypothetical protein
MRKLSREQERQKTLHAERLAAALATYNERVAELNAALDPLRGAVEQAAAGYNEVLGGAREFVREVADAAEEYVSARSEKWSESGAGAAYVAWQETWSGYDPSELEPDMPQDMEEHDGDDSEAFDNLPTEPESE